MLSYPFFARRTVARAVILAVMLAGAATLLYAPPNLDAQADARVSAEVDFNVLPIATAQSDASGIHLHKHGVSGFKVLLRDGESVCREATQAEVIRTQQRAAVNPMRQIAAGTRSETQAASASGMRIILRGTPQLDSFPQAKAAFLRAAAQWESIIESPITIIIDVDFGEENFGDPFENDVIGLTTTQLVGAATIYSPLRDQIINLSLSPARRAVLGLLPASGLPTNLGRTTAIVGPATIFRALQFLGAVANPVDEEDLLGPPPTIGFNSRTGFDFDPSDGITPGLFDFEATAIHEIGHALGFFSSVGQQELNSDFGNQPTALDFFRFRPGIAFGAFETADRVQSPGGEHIFFAGAAPLALSTARSDGQGGDGRQASHWKDDAQTGVYLGIMDPTLRSGRREIISANDLYAFASLGYRIRTPDRAPTVELAADDGQAFGGVVGAENLILVNRLTPTAYPARLDAVRIYIAQFTNTPNPTGAPIRLLAFAGSGTPQSNPILLLDQVAAIPPIVGAGNFIEIPITNGPVIDSGDFFIGFQRLGGTVQNSFAGVIFPIDDGSPAAMRTFASTDNGATFAGPLTVTRPGSTMPVPANLMVRGRVAVARGARIIGSEALAGDEISLPVEFLAKGDEAQIRFSLAYDRDLLDFVELVPGEDGAPTLQTQPDPVQGRIGVSFVNPQGSLFAGGRRRLARAVFRIRSNAAPGTTMIEFGDAPTARSILNVNAGNILSETSFTSALVTIAESAAVVSGASFDGSEIAPESIAAVFGSNLAIGVRSATATPLPAAILGTSVEVRDSIGRRSLASLFFVSSGQINFQIPPGMTPGPATVAIRSGDDRLAIVRINIANLAPGLFAANSDGTGAAAANVLRVRGAAQSFEEFARLDAALNRFVPVLVDLGPEGDLVFLILYGTGLRFRSENAAVSATVGEIPTTAPFIGPAGGFIGLDQINLGPIPRSLAGRGLVDIRITIDGKTTNVVQAAFK
ncbi:MAG: NF038122 family metalloprotease [Acidobacteria bacterium]|nr:NF038122 family metalloprotease [Acidobacteriota bacterium]MCW5970816.1 NF038122 family metalloprotease [Blastocatellales bacterium]